MTKIAKSRKEQLAVLAAHSGVTSLEKAVELVKSCAKAKFDETVDLDVKLGIDPRHSDQMTSGSVSLPNGTGKKVRVVVFTQEGKEKAAKDAGADQVGSEDLIADVLRTGKLNADVVISEPSMMPKMAKIARILGPRGLMPNPKFGTVTPDIPAAVKKQKAGQIRFRNDKGANVHVSVGKVSFSNEAIVENVRFFLAQLAKLRAETVKGTFMLATSLSSTMGPGVAFSATEKKVSE